MVKQKSRGYTLLELLIVMSTISIMSLLMLSRINQSIDNLALNKQIELLEGLVMRAKYESYLLKENKVIYIYEDMIIYDEVEYPNYRNVFADSSYLLSYNMNGNIAKVATIKYTNKKKEKKIAFEIGGGYYEEK